ncbi:hypothetical protein LMG24238_03265 [Paraburkholderia sediminicola]|uniref:Uncharacterized protein n=1 Tax=Paraburkholderia sediminicola TaxID=458836 RepID=A0A6J5B7Y6_9BURK|nr:hypothetical protein LMG24238_03265 [Paraburkholderia sediminicola]
MTQASLSRQSRINGKRTSAAQQQAEIRMKPRANCRYDSINVGLSYHIVAAIGKILSAHTPITKSLDGRISRSIQNLPRHDNVFFIIFVPISEITDRRSIAHSAIGGDRIGHCVEMKFLPYLTQCARAAVVSTPHMRLFCVRYKRFSQFFYTSSLSFPRVISSPYSNLSFKIRPPNWPRLCPLNVSS